MLFDRRTKTLVEKKAVQCPPLRASQVLVRGTNGLHLCASRDPEHPRELVSPDPQTKMFQKSAREPRFPTLISQSGSPNPKEVAP